jgi:hypothetical protein
MTDQTNIYGWHTDWTILDEYPAFQIISPSEEQTFIGFVDDKPQYSDSPYRPFSAGTEVMVQVPGNGIAWRAFTFGSSASFALENQECPIAAYDRSVAKKEETHWLNQNSVMISDHKEAQKVLYGLQMGDTVHFEGRDFILTPASNGNIILNEEEL